MRSLPLKLILPLLATIWAGPVSASSENLERFAGSFELETGEVITGGPFVERVGDPTLFLYMDTDGLSKGGVFRQESEYVFQSVSPPGQEIRFSPDDEGALQNVTWSDSDGTAQGRRIYPHDARTVTIWSEGAELAGRFLEPRCRGPHPLVVLISGSGPTTRWGGAFETFFVSLGMSVLTYDKRGIGAEDWSEPDLSTLAMDAAAALRFGMAQPNVDVNRSGYWASSQGGWVAPMAAVEQDINFLIVRVGPGVSQMEAYLHETRQEARQAGLGGLDLDHASALRREIYELAIAGQPLGATDQLVDSYLAEPWYQEAFGNDYVSRMWSPRWWGWAQRNMAVAPGPYLEQLDAPVLWFLAEQDENVPLVPSQTRLREAFAVSPSDDEMLVTIPGANHAFLVARENGEIGYADGFFSGMRQWLHVRGLSGEGCWARAE